MLFQALLVNSIAGTTLVPEGVTGVVETPWKVLPASSVYFACAAENAVVADIVKVTPYDKPITSNGRANGSMRYVAVDLSVRRVVWGQTTSSLQIHLSRTVHQDSIQPRVGLRYALAYTRLREDSPMWAKGTPLIRSHLQLTADEDLPDPSYLTAHLRNECVRRDWPVSQSLRNAR